MDGDGDVTVDFGNGAVRAYPKGTFFTENGVVTLDSKLWLIEAYVNASSEAGKSHRDTQGTLTGLEIKFLATVAGEGLSTHNAIEWRAIAHTIMNRVGNYEWAGCSLDDVLIPSQFHAVGGNQYDRFMSYVATGRSNTHSDAYYYEQLIAAVLPIVRGEEPDFTGGAVFFAGGPSSWTGEEVMVAGTSHHKFYLYPMR